MQILTRPGFVWGLDRGLVGFKIISVQLDVFSWDWLVQVVIAPRVTAFAFHFS